MEHRSNFKQREELVQRWWDNHPKSCSGDICTRPHVRIWKIRAVLKVEFNQPLNPIRLMLTPFFRLCTANKTQRHFILSLNFISACRNQDDLSIFIPVFILKYIDKGTLPKHSKRKRKQWRQTWTIQHNYSAGTTSPIVFVLAEKPSRTEVLIGAIGEKSGWPDAGAWGWCLRGHHLHTGWFGHLRHPQGGTSDLQCSSLWKKSKNAAVNAEVFHWKSTFS